VKGGNKRKRTTSGPREKDINFGRSGNLDPGFSHTELPWDDNKKVTQISAGNGNESPQDRRLGDKSRAWVDVNEDGGPSTWNFF